MIRRTAGRGLYPHCARASLLVLITTIVSWQSAALAATYYVAPTGGSDVNAGSLAAPFGTISHAISVAGRGIRFSCAAAHTTFPAP